VRDSGAGKANGNGTGHGLVGMRERVAMFGGELDAAAQPDGGFAVRARLPLDAPT
jgi:signal transduction histidine kinase